MNEGEGNVMNEGEGNVMKGGEGNVMKGGEGNVMKGGEGNVIKEGESIEMKLHTPDNPPYPHRMRIIDLFTSPKRKSLL